MKVGDVIQDYECPEDKGIIVKIGARDDCVRTGKQYLIIELTTGTADWYNASYVDECYLVLCEQATL